MFFLFFLTVAFTRHIGLKLDITYLSSVFLSTGTTDAILALFVKEKVLILLFMGIASGSAKMSDANLTSLAGILSILGTYSLVSKLTKSHKGNSHSTNVEALIIAV